MLSISISIVSCSISNWSFLKMSLLFWIPLKEGIGCVKGGPKTGSRRQGYFPDNSIVAMKDI
jgi:hypothetical protein